MALPSSFYGLHWGGGQDPVDLEAVSRSGAKYFHLQMSKTSNVGNQYDDVFEEAWKRGITILPYLYGPGPEFPTLSKVEGEGTGAGSWLHFVYSAVHRYGFNGDFWSGKSNPEPVPAWEVWNEPNFAANNPGGENVQPEEYAKFARRTSQAILAAQEEKTPGAGTRVNFGNLFSAGNKSTEGGAKYSSMNVGLFLEEAADILGEGTWFTGVSLHPYAFKPTAEKSVFEKVKDNVNYARSKINEHFTSSHELWITELGWNVDRGTEEEEEGTFPPATETEQAEYLTESFNWITEVEASKNIHALIYYNNRDIDGSPEWDRFAGLIENHDDQPYEDEVFRPAWDAFQDQTGASDWPVEPGVSTSAATGVQAKQATLNGAVDPNGLPTEYEFEWGTTTGYGETSSPASTGWEDKSVSKSKPLTGLSPNTTYHYRIVATNENAEDNEGADREFTTPSIPPSVLTVSGTPLSSNDAFLVGMVIPENLETSYWFEYGETPSYGSKTALKSAGSGTEAVPATQDVSGLKANTEYHLRIVASNEKGTSYGSDVTFTTPKSPKATTEAATGIGTNEATLHGKVNPEGLETSYLFEYGTTIEYGSDIPVKWKDIGSGVEDVEVEEGLEGLEKGTTYHYRLVARHPGTTIYGEDETFSTLKVPQATTEAASGIQTDEATLNAKVNPEGSATSYLFEYGTSAEYGSKVPAEAKGIGSGTEDVAVEEAIEGLAEGTAYHFRVVAESPAGTSYGEDGTFTTLKVPKATTEAATGVGTDEATLNASVNPEGSATSYHFEYGTSAEYGSKAPAEAEGIGSGTEDVGVEETIEELAEGTTYHYRVVAESPAGTSYGEDETFVTLKVPKVTALSVVELWATEATLYATIYPEGSETSYFFEYGTSTEYGSVVPAEPESIGSGTSPVGVFEEIEGLAPETTYHFRVVAESPAGTTYREDGTFTTLASPPTFDLDAGEEGSGEGQLSGPRGVAVGPEGDLWVANVGNDRIERFDPEGEFLSSFGEEGSGEGQLDRPFGLTVDAAGDIWVADTFNGRVQRFGSEGEYQGEFETAGEFPTDVAIDAEGNVWVTEFVGAIAKYSPAGELLAEGGTSGEGQLGFLLTGGLALDPEGDVWVADNGNHRVVEFDSEGEYLRSLGQENPPGTEPWSPQGLALDSKGNVWVADTGNDRVTRYSPEGELVTAFGGSGSGSGEGELSGPTGLAVDSQDGIWVSDTGNDRIQRWSYRPPGAVTEAASGIGAEKATLNATVDPEGLQTDYFFEYGTTAEYGSKVPAEAKGIGAGTEGVEVEEAIEGLSPETEYHFRVVAENVAGASYGEDETFSTPPPLQFAAAEYPASIGSNSSQFYLEMPESYVECEAPDLVGSLSAPAGALSLDLDFGGAETCEGSLGTMTANPNSCDFDFGISGGAYSGDFSIVCEEEGDAIELEGENCTIAIGPQTRGEELGYINKETEPSRVLAAGWVNGVAYTADGPYEGFFCSLAGIPAEAEDGVLLVFIYLEAANEAEEAIDFFVSEGS